MLASWLLVVLDTVAAGAGTSSAPTTTKFLSIFYLFFFSKINTF
jgi:hypothetical protein